jgi:general secretion pathway protein G
MVLRKREIQKIVRRGFTLMEVLVVVAIILILASLGGYYVMGQLAEARKSEAKIQVRTLTTACENYELNYRQRPQQLSDLLNKGEMGGPYLKSSDLLIDPWGKPYVYNREGPNNRGLTPDISTTDPDGRVIGNWGKASGP